MAFWTRLERIRRTLAAEIRRRRATADGDGRLVRERAMMVLLTTGHDIEDGVVTGDGPFVGVAEKDALAAVAGASFAGALRRLEKLARTHRREGKNDDGND